MGKYLYKNESGKTLQEIPLVLPPRRLTGVVTDDTSNIVTVDSTEGVWPGMAYDGPYIADGVHAYVRNVLSETALEIWGSKWDAGTGFFTLSAEDGVPAETDSDPGRMATVSGFRDNALCFDPQGVWMNEIESTGTVAMPVGYTNGGGSNLLSSHMSKMPYTFDPQYTFAGGAATMLTIGQPLIFKSDSMADVPLKRHNGVPRAFWLLVSAGGYVSKLPALSKHSCAFAGTDAADEVTP